MYKNNRPGIAGTVLQTALSLINKLTCCWPFYRIFILYLHQYSWEAETLAERSPMMTPFFQNINGRFGSQWIRQGEGSLTWRVCYQQGFPILVVTCNLWNYLQQFDDRIYPILGSGERKTRKVSTILFWNASNWTTL